MAEMKKDLIWYHVNFSNDLYFSGKTTRFLRVAIPPHYDETKLVPPEFDPNNIPNPRQYWCTLIPILSFKDGSNINSLKPSSIGSPMNDVLSQYSINGINAKTMYDEIYNTRMTYDCFNLYGTSTELHEDIKAFIGPYNDSFTFADPYHWQMLQEGFTYEYRIDYEGNQDELIKFIFLISEFKPDNSGKFIHGYLPWANLGSALMSYPPEPDNVSYGGSPDFPFPGYSQNALSKGVKGINDFLCGSNPEGFTYVSEDINTTGTPSYYEFPKIPLRIDYIDLDICGIVNEKHDKKVNVSPFGVDENAIHNDTMSHMMIRTNPMLSGNVSITTDSKGDIWLNSIDANNQLSDSRFKKYRLSPQSSYAADLYKFFDDGTVPAEIVFDLRQYDSSYQYTKNSLYLEYDNFYGYGVQQLNSKFYDEEFTFFAPLWLKRELPDFFVIFKCDHPLSTTSYENLGDKALVKDLINNSMILTTFDMREGSKIGNYLRNIINGARFKEQPLHVSFDQDSLSTWNGIAYDRGVVAEKGELLYNVFTKDRTIKEFEDYITSGYKRNKLICQNLVNLEFLFDDVISEEYTINRYFGLYVNTIDLDYFMLSEDVLFQLKEQIPMPRRDIDAVPYAMNVFNQTNDNGIVLPVESSLYHKLETGKDPFNKLSTIVSNKDRFFAVRDRSSQLKRIKSVENKNLNQLLRSIDYKEIRLFDKTIDISKFTGIDRFSSQLKATLKDAGPAQMVLHLYDGNSDEYIFNPGEIITISWDNNIEHHEWQMIANETSLQRGDWWDYPVYNNDTYTFQNTFNPTGTSEQVAKAITGCINQFDDDFFEAHAEGNKVYIRISQEYDGGNYYAIKRSMVENSIANNMKLYDIDPVVSEEGTPSQKYYKYNFVGGNSRSQNRAKVDITNGKNVEANDWFQCQSQKYSKVKEFNVGAGNVHILPYLDEPIRDAKGNITGFLNIDKYVIIELSDEFAFYTSNEGYIVAYKIYNIPFCVLSSIPVKDFDFDFFYSEYAYSPVAELLKYFEFYELLNAGDVQELPMNEFFKVINGSGTLQGYANNAWTNICNVNSSIALESSFNTLPYELLWNDDKRCYEFVEKFNAFRIIRNSVSTNMKVVRYLYSEQTITAGNIVSGHPPFYRVPKDVLDASMIEFPGFAGLSDIYTDVDESVVALYKANEDFRRFTYPLLNSEYDRLLENNLKEFVLKSRVVPYINKWVNLGTDVRDNKYRLNMSNAFGITGYSPSADGELDPSLFTHEWYYLDRHPEGYPNDLMKNSRSYMFAKLDDVPFPSPDLPNPEYANFYDKTWKELLYSTEVDFFTKYFTVGYPHDVADEELYRKREERFVFTEYIKGLEEIQCMFRGAKIKIKELGALGNEIKGSARYKDYKFASILTLKEQERYQYTDPYDIEIIDNRKFKAITFIITIYLQDYKFNDFLSYVSLYTSTNALKNDNVYTDIYSDIDLTTLNPVHDLYTDYVKRLGENRFSTIIDYKDVEVMSIITKLPNNKFSINKNRQELHDFDYDEYQPVDAGSLENAYSIKTYEPLAGKIFYYGKIISFEGFLSIINRYPTMPIIPLQNAYPPMVKLYLNVYDMLTPIRHATVAEVCRFSPFYPDNTMTVSGPVITLAGSMLAQNFYSKGIYYLAGVNLHESYTYPMYYPSTDDINNLQNYLLNAGQNYNKYLLERIAFSNIRMQVNNKNNAIRYVSVEEDNTVGINKFQLEFLNYTDIIKSDVLRTAPDNDKPAELQNEVTIGYVLDTIDMYEKIQRFNGNFEPKARDVIIFALNEDVDMIEYFGKDFILLNTRMNTEHVDNAIIKNLSINKVNMEEILKVTNSLAYFNVYPLVNKISIDNKNHNIMLSSWDNLFYREYQNKDIFTEEQGLRDMQEIKTFFGSKVMNVPPAHDLDSFINNEYVESFIVPIGANVGTLTHENKSNIQSSDDGKPTLRIVLDLKERLIRKFFSENIRKEFDWVKNNVSSIFSGMSDDELDLVVNDYIEKNIIDLYEVEYIYLYGKSTTRTAQIENLDADVPERYYKLYFNLTESTILNSGYKVEKTVKFEKDKDNPLLITIVIDIDTNLYKEFAIIARVKRI